MFDAVSVFIFLVTVAIFGFFLTNIRGQTNHGKNYPPSLPSLPFVGSLPYVSGGMRILPDFFIETSKKLGPVFSYYTNKEMVVVLNGKQALYEALVKRAEAFADRAEFWTEANLHNKELRGIAFAHYDDVFRKYHKLSLSIMREFGFGVSHESDVRVWNEVEDLLKTLRNYNSRPVYPKDALVNATSKVIMNFLFGGGLQPVDTYIRKLTHTANIITENLDPAINMAPIIRFLPHYRKKIDALNKATAEMMQGLEEAIQHVKSDQSKENSFAKRFLEIEGPNYDHQDLLYILRDLSLASTDSMSITLYWAILEMANHPVIQSRVQKEIDENLPNDRLPSYEDRRHLPYTEAAVLESLRFRTLLPLSFPHSTLKDSEVCGYNVPKGCLVITNLLSVHRDPDIWKDPQNFRPERFLDEHMHIVGRENVLAFSLGKRTCTGEALARHEVFVFFSSIMQHFDVQPPEGVDLSRVECVYGLNVEPKHVELRFIPRK